ncbi:MAG: Mov34/MPN/PAD-1 family protein [Candidatus Bathyarchaeia archaeon]
MKKKLVCINRSVLDSILDYSKACHPKEGILLLKGRVSRNKIIVDDVEIPPLSVRGFGFSNFPLHMLPIDFSVIGTAHSHPSGVLRPSITDLNKFYGRIMIIAAYPYTSEQNTAIFDSKGNRIRCQTVE